MTQPNDDCQLSDSPPRNDYQLSDTDRINHLESSVASFNHMVVLVMERVDSLEAARHEPAIADPVPHAMVSLGQRIDRLRGDVNTWDAHLQDQLSSNAKELRQRLVALEQANTTHKDVHDNLIAIEAELLGKLEIRVGALEVASPSKGAQVVTGPLPSHSYMDQIKKSLKIIETECDILKHLWRQP